LNRGHKDFQSSALPTELSCQPGAHIELGFAAHGKSEFNEITLSHSNLPSMREAARAIKADLGQSDESITLISFARRKMDAHICFGRIFFPRF
jgi:hypothetical protein